MAAAVVQVAAHMEHLELVGQVTPRQLLQVRAITVGTETTLPQITVLVVAVALGVLARTVQVQVGELEATEQAQVFLVLLLLMLLAALEDKAPTPLVTEQTHLQIQVMAVVVELLVVLLLLCLLAVLAVLAS
jgi:hypothetical protein